MEISTLILWRCLVLFVWWCGGFFFFVSERESLSRFRLLNKVNLSWCIETQQTVVTSWICQRILGEVRDDCSVPNVHFAVSVAW